MSSKSHGFAAAALLLTCLAVTGCGDGPGGLTSPTPVVIGGDPANPGGAATLGFVQDIKPLLDGDCISCHNTRTANGRVDLTTFTSVMTVRAGARHAARRLDVPGMEWRPDSKSESCQALGGRISGSREPVAEAT
jgi:hypothetical protein